MADFQGLKDQKFSFKKPWLFGEYEKMQQTIDEAEIYLGEGLVTVESQYKKPYNKLDHPTSENFFDGPGGTPLVPGQVPWGLPGNDCRPAGTGIGGGALNPCVPQLSCGQWAWTCAHRITKFTAIGGWMQSVQYGANDSVTATVCWDESHGGSTIIGMMVNTADGAVFQSKIPLDCLGPGHDNTCLSCLDCTGAGHTPVISYTTQQMSLNGTQNLSAIGGGGGPYTWSIVSGGGTLSTTKTGPNQNVMYSAPSSNANCANNPTIRVKDYCGNTKDLKLAINNPSQHLLIAYDITTCHSCGANCVSFTSAMVLCDNSSGGAGGGCGSTHPGNTCLSALGCTGDSNCGPTGAGHDCIAAKYDDRDIGGDGKKSLGCCPAGLL